MFYLLLVILTISSPILIIIFISKYFKYKAKINNQLTELRKDLDGKDTRKLQEEITQLKARTEVLERIITDSNYELNDKISKLA